MSKRILGKNISSMFKLILKRNFYRLIEHESCEKLYRDIMEQLTYRQKFSRTSFKYSELSANIRLKLKQFNNEVGQLNEKLEIIAKTGNMYPSM